MAKISLFYRKNLIRLILKINQVLGKLGALPEKGFSCATLDTIHKKLGPSDVSIQLYEKDKENKEFAMEVLKIFSNFRNKCNIS